MAKTENRLSEKPSLFKLTVPIYVEYLLAMLVGNLDQMMISRYDNNCVTAIGNANQVLNLLVMTFTIVNTATTVLITQYIGAGRKEQIPVTHTLAVFLNLVGGGLISAALFFGADPIFDFLGPPEWVREDFRAYMQIVGGTLFLQSVFSTFSAIFKSHAQMRPVMLLSVVMNVVNVATNAILIYGIGPFPQLGIRGAALGTVVSRLVVTVLIIILYFRYIRISLSPKNLCPFPFDQLRRIAAIGIPSGGEGVSYNITTMVIMIMINTFGQTAINTKLYASMFAMVTWMFASSVSQASGILVGYHMGGRDHEAADRQVRRTLLLSVIVTTSIAVLLRLISDPLFGFMNADAAVVTLGKTILMIDIILELGRAVNIVMVRSLQATGDVIFPIGLSISSTWLIAVGLSWLFGIRLGMGLPGVWLAMACDELTRAVIFLFRWKSGKWRTKNVID